MAFFSAPNRFHKARTLDAINQVVLIDLNSAYHCYGIVEK